MLVNFVLLVMYSLSYCFFNITSDNLLMLYTKYTSGFVTLCSGNCMLAAEYFITNFKTLFTDSVYNLHLTIDPVSKR